MADDTSTSERNQNGFAGVFTEAEYRADAKRVVAHAVATGRAIVTRADGTTRVVLSIPPAAAPIFTER